MTRKIWRGTLFFLSLWIFTGSPAVPLEAFPNEPQGFRGAPWWSGVHRFSGLLPFEQDGSWELYRREGEYLQFGNALLDDVLYFFANRRFSGVLLASYGINNREYLLQEALRRWGPGEVFLSGGDISGYFWYGSSVAVLLEYNALSEEARLVMTPFFPRDSRGKDLRELQRDFSVLVGEITPQLRSIPFRRGAHLFSSGKERSFP